MSPTISHDPTQDQLVLYSYFRSSTAYRTRIALHLKGVPFIQKTVHLLEGGGQQHSPDYRSINPAGEVPSLIHRGQTLSQSMAIIEYLDALYPTPPLLTGSPFDQAKIRQIAEHINCGIHPIANLKVQQYLTRELGATEDQKTKWVQYWIRLGMEALENIVSKTAGEYAYKDQLSLADLFIIPQIFSSQRFGVPLDSYPTLRRINEKCLEQQAFRLAHPHVQPDTPSELRGKV